MHIQCVCVYIYIYIERERLHFMMQLVFASIRKPTLGPAFVFEVS